MPQMKAEMHRDSSHLENVFRSGRHTVWACVSLFFLETLGVVLCIIALIKRISEYDVVHWPALWVPTAVTFAIMALAYLILLYINRYSNRYGCFLDGIQKWLQ
jgi:hypothetical protein